MNKPTITYGEEKPVYFVMAEGGDAPTKEHTSRFNAINEATRLSRKHPGVKFSVLKLKAAMIFGEATTPTTSERDKQILARAALQNGGAVRVRDDHHEFPGWVGKLTRFGSLDANDTSVYVQLRGHDYETRFAPTSLVKITQTSSPTPGSATDKEAAPKADAASAPSIGSLLADFIIDTALGELGRLMTGDKEDVPGGISAEQKAERQRDMDRAAAIAPGSPVLAIMGSNPLYGTLAPGRLLGSTPDRSLVRVDFSEVGGPEEELVNVSRVYAANDRAVYEAAGYL